jgi:hypothetical protein
VSGDDEVVKPCIMMLFFLDGLDGSSNSGNEAAHVISDGAGGCLDAG